jgi:hypothetical protein
VGQICNLVSEFNGLVSKRVGRKISPFYCKIFSLVLHSFQLFFEIIFFVNRVILVNVEN